MDPSQRTAWEAFLADPHEASFQPFYEQTKALVYTICFRILRNPEDAADAFQSTYCRLLASVRDGESPADPREIDALVSRLTVREAGNLRDRRRRLQRREVHMDKMPEPADPSTTPHEAAVDAERRGKIEALVAGLPEKYRLPLLLHYFDGLTQAQIARVLGRPESTIRGQMARGLKKLRVLARRAGLGDPAAFLGGAVAVAHLIDPPATLAAAAVFAQAKGFLVAGAAGGTAAGGAGGTLLGAFTGGAVMKAKIAVVGAVVALGAAGLIVPTMLKSTREEQEPRGVASVARPDAPGRDSSAGSPGAGGADGSKAAPPRSHAAVMEADEQSASSQGSDLAAKGQARTTTRSLAVRVVWQGTGKAASGATVRLERRRERSAASGSGVPPAPRNGVSAKRPSPAADAVQVETQEGNASLAFPGDWGAARLIASHAEAAAHKADLDLQAASGPLRIELRRGAILVGKVYEKDTGQAVVGAEVRVSGTDVKATTGSDGTYEMSQIPSGAIRVAAERPPLRSYSKEAEIPPISLEPGERRRHSLTLELHPILTGVVRDAETKEPLSGATVSIWSKYATQTDERGVYRLEDLAKREGYEITANAPGYVAWRARVGFLGPEDVLCNFDLEPGGQVDVRVVDGQGSPVEDAGIGFYDGPAWRATGDKTDAQGRARVDGVGFKSPRGLYAEKEGYKRMQHPEAPLFRSRDDIPETTLTLEKAPPPTWKSFEGRVTDESGEPIAGAEVRCELVTDHHIREEATSSGEDGHYVLALKDPDEIYWLTASATDWAPITKRDVRPGPEDNPFAVDFIMEPAHWIEGLIVGPDDEPLPKVSVQAYKTGFGASLCIRGASTTSDTEGRFRVEGLPAKEVRLQFSGGGVSEKWETLEVDKEVRIVLNPVGVIKGRVLDAETRAPVRDFTVKVLGKGIDTMRGTTGESFSSPDGRFVLRGLGSGDKHEVRVETSGFPPTVRKDILAAPEDDAEEIVFHVGKGQLLKGALVDAASGQPVAGALVVYGFRKKDMGFSWEMLKDAKPYFLRTDVQRTVSDEEGAFAFQNTDDKGTLFIKPERRRPIIVEPGERALYGAPAPLRIPLMTAGSVSGICFFGGAAKPHAVVELGRSGQCHADAEGHFRFDGVSKGTHTLFASNGRLRLSRQIHLEENEDKVVNMGDDVGPLSLSGRTLRHGDVPVKDITIQILPAFAWNYTFLETTSDAEGRYRIDGLRAGTYDARVNGLVDEKFRSLREEIRVGADAEHDFSYARVHKITARLVFPPDFPPEIRSALTWANFDAINRAPADETGADAADLGGSSPVGNGGLVFEGRFRGEYSLRIGHQSGDERSEIVSPRTFQLDNFEGDQNLGEIEMPSIGLLRLRVAFDPRPARAPRAFEAYLIPRDPSGPSRPQSLDLQFGQADQAPRPVAAGAYDLRVPVPGFRSDPQAAPLEITPGGATDASVTLRPEGMIIGTILGTSPYRPVTVNRVSLVGPGVQRALEPRPDPAGERIHPLLRGDGDLAAGNEFAFRGLPAATYELTIEAEGYEPWHATRTVVPGEQPDSLDWQVHLTALQ